MTSIGRGEPQPVLEVAASTVEGTRTSNSSGRVYSNSLFEEKMQPSDIIQELKGNEDYVLLL